MIKKRYLTIIVLLFCSNLLFAQEAPSPFAWGGGADQQDLSFGFSFSYVSTYFKILKNPDWRSPFLDKQNGNAPVTSDLNSLSSPNSPGFAVGFLTRYRITEHLEARITPSLIFADRQLSYVYANPSDNVKKSVQSTTVDFPLLLKLKSDRLGNFRAYLLGGVKYSYAIGAKKSDAEAALLDKTVKTVSGYASYEAGLGCDIYFEYFKMSPEIKLSNSMGNVLVPENQPFSAPISKLSLHTLMFSLYFE
ncbi:probable protein-translocating porin PorT [Mucilaginibacter mallensis]|uniref:Probable protein-translocating porin PorT n=1 Tax=Mucilaginibacter mallensis TaxID=652787 RepID=A0A1H2A4D2_MUCMA|nr:outer membrane beta-barrel protein [Mucilaginibacter mallensis]SDT40841.1 probable protein-translocating porin PorT [Mucilaginibacter mallensis]